jgi:hypothetical protein
MEEPALCLGPLARRHGVPTTCHVALAIPLGAPQITVEQNGKHIFFGNAAGAPGHRSFYLLFNDC